MRLTDVCTLKSNGATIGPEARPCEFGHTGAGTESDPRRTVYRETARVIIGPDLSIAALSSISGWTVLHHGRSYKVDGVLPRYRPGGRLHHVSLVLDTATAG